mgnify:CR=1 FL=1
MTVDIIVPAIIQNIFFFVCNVILFNSVPRFERGLDGSEPSGLPLADRAKLVYNC